MSPGRFICTKTKSPPPTGQRYIPYGIVVTGLGNPNWARRRPGDAAEITASADSWCASTVELEVFQYAMFNADGSVNSTFLGLVESEVSQALGLGLVVAITDQTEGGPPNSGGLPEAQTKTFWNVLNGIYGHNTDVIFDLYNEPRRVGAGNKTSIWKYWRNSGTYQGTKYMGNMSQTLASYLRRIGSRNLFWIEGPHTGGSLQYIKQYQVTKAGPLEYGEDHPGMVNSPHNAAYWNIRPDIFLV